MENKKQCPRCKCEIIGYPALSRVDNKTDICSECGIKEAMYQFTKIRQLPPVNEYIQ